MKKSWVIKPVVIALILVIVSVVHFYTAVPLIIALVVAVLFSLTVPGFDGKFYSRHGGAGCDGGDGGGL